MSVFVPKVVCRCGKIRPASVKRCPTCLRGMEDATPYTRPAESKRPTTQLDESRFYKRKKGAKVFPAPEPLFATTHDAATHPRRRQMSTRDLEPLRRPRRRVPALR